MKKGILAVCIVLALAALVWFGGRKFFGAKEADAEVAETGVSDVSASDVSVSDVETVETKEAVPDDAEEEETASVSGNTEQLAETEEPYDGEMAEESAAGEETAEDKIRNAIEEIIAPSDEGTLYTIKTSEGSNLGMVPIVNGNAVVMMDGGSGTTHQGEYITKEQSAFQMKLEEQKALAASEGTIKAWAFYRESSMKDFVFPEGVSAIEKFAFARSGLQSVVIPDGVTSIGNGAFYHCDNLSDVTIPESVTVIEENAFAHTPWLENWMAEGEEDFLIVGDGILLAYRGSEEDLELPPEVKSIAPGAFGE